jgi:hypothetical protein
VITPLRKIFLFGFAALLGARAHAQTVIASDNFNRANESPFAVTGNWGRVVAGNYNGNSSLVSNQVRSVVNEGIYYWKGAGTFDSTRQYAKEKIVQKDGEAGLVLLGGPDHAIMLMWGPPGVGNTLYIYWYKNGLDQGVLKTVPSSLVNGDVVEAVLENGIITAKVNGAVVTTVANTTTIPSGTPGFITYLDPNLPTKIGILDDWEGGTPLSYSISGTILEGGVGLSGVTVAASGGATGSTTTNASGAYTLAGVPPGATSVVVTPTKSGHTMTPLTRTVAGPVNANVTGQNFTSAVNTTATLTVNTSHGTVAKNPNLATYPLGSQVTLTPSPDASYSFAGWSGDVPAGHTSDNPLVLTMDQDRVVSAGFVTAGVVASDDFNRADEIPMSVTGNWRRFVNGGTGNLSGGRFAGAAGVAIYYWQGAGTFDAAHQFVRARVVDPAGEVGIALLAGSDQAIIAGWSGGSLFIDWYASGSYKGTLTQVSSTLFAGDIIQMLLDSGNITVSINGFSVLTVANTTGLSSGRPGLETYATGGVLDDWEAGNTLASCSIGGTILENAAGLANVQVTASGGFAGTATTNANGSYVLTGVPQGATSIVLTPTLPGHVMTPTTRTVAGPVVAGVTGQDFASAQSSSATLTILAPHGSVTKSPDLATYPINSQVTLTPVADGGYAFSSWSGDVPAGQTTDNPLALTMSQDRTVTANFTAPAVVAVDYFERSDETPLAVGGNWIQPFSSGSAALLGNRASGSQGEALYYWQGAGVFDNTRQFARARVVQAGGQVGLVLLGTSQKALVAAWGGGRLYIYWYSNSAYMGELANVPATLANGDVIEAVLDAGTIYAKRNGAVVTSVPNSTSLAVGRPGFETYLSGAVFDDWESGIPPLPCAAQPSEILGVGFQSKTPTVLAWPSGGNDSFDVASSTLGDLRSNGTTTAGCLSNNGTAATYTDSRPNPAVGTGFYYLIRAQSSCGAGTYGFASSGTERIPVAACP